MQPRMLLTTLSLILASFVLQGSCYILVRPFRTIFFHHDNYVQNPVISGWKGSTSIMDLAPKIGSPSDLPDSLPSSTKRDFPMAPPWRYRFPF